MNALAIIILLFFLLALSWPLVLLFSVLLVPVFALAAVAFAVLRVGFSLLFGLLLLPFRLLGGIILLLLGIPLAMLTIILLPGLWLLFWPVVIVLALLYLLEPKGHRQ